MSFVVNIMFPLKDGVAKPVELEQSTTVQELSEFFQEEYNCPSSMKVYFTLEGDPNAQPLRYEASFQSLGVASSSKIYGWVKEVSQNQPVPQPIEQGPGQTKDVIAGDEDIVVRLVQDMDGRTFQLKLPPTSSIGEIKAFYKETTNISSASKVDIFLGQGTDPLPDQTRLNELPQAGDIMLRAKRVFFGGAY